MALNVDPIMTADPPSIPAAGGSTTVTFQASTDQGAGQLMADYGVDPGAPFSIVGPQTLAATAVSVVPRNYDMLLTFQPTNGGASFTVTVTVVEVGTGDTTVGHCLVTVDLGAGGAGGAAPPLGS